ncbi:MAG TPA: DUF4838 domain-containing protein, partial [Armatimonadota bacterium]
LGRITGASFPLVEATPGTLMQALPAIVLGEFDDKRANRLPVKLLAGDRDNYILVSDDRALWIRGVNSRSTLYGVYDLLETLGCQFIEPGIEVVPSSPTLEAPALCRREIAGFALRNIFRNSEHFQKSAPFIFMDPEIHLPQIDWMAKRRLNHYEFYVDFYQYNLWEQYKGPVLDALLDRGFDLEVTHHSIHYFCPPDENHDFGEYGEETYQRHHPDWYLPSYEIGSRGRWQTRVELPEIRRVITRRFLEFAGRNPELKILGLWPDDIPMNAPIPGQAPADGYIDFWNEIAGALAVDFPDKLLSGIAYFELIEPPKVNKPASNMHCWFCPIGRTFMYPLTNEQNKKNIGYMRGWIDAMPPNRVGSFEYYGWTFPYLPLREYMRDELRLYREMGLGGIYGWSGFGLNIMGREYRYALDLFALSRFLWNPDAELRPLEEQWASAVYAGSAPEVLDFYDLMRTEQRAEREQGLYSSFEWINLDLVHRGQAILARARSKAATPEITRRVDFLEKHLCHGATAEVWREGPPTRFGVF